MKKIFCLEICLSVSKESCMWININFRATIEDVVDVLSGLLFWVFLEVQTTPE